MQKINIKFFNGEKSVYRDIVVLKAAAGFLIADKVCNLKNGIIPASQLIDNMKAIEAINNYKKFLSIN